jgi:hypothetical protein
LLQEAINPTYLLAWIPESLLNERGSSERDKFVRVEERAAQTAQEEEDEGVLYPASVVQQQLTAV